MAGISDLSNLTFFRSIIQCSMQQTQLHVDTQDQKPSPLKVCFSLTGTPGLLQVTFSVGKQCVVWTCLSLAWMVLKVVGYDKGGKGIVGGTVEDMHVSCWWLVTLCSHSRPGH